MRLCEILRHLLWTLTFFCAWPLECFCYKTERLQDNLCSDTLFLALTKTFRGDPILSLTDDQNSAAIITQMWNTTLDGGPSVNKIKYDCQFRVHTNQRPLRGIYTIISRLKFRRDPATNKCIDYIQFSSGNRSPSERICHEISVNGAGRLIFDQRDRDANVRIYIEKHRVIFDEPLELHMVLTAHSECQFPSDFLCEPKNPYSCISRHFVRDNVTNCLYPCRDEGTCFLDAIPPEEMDTANVAISAITSLIFTMLGVGFCVWICWKYWNCITVQQHAHEASAARFNQGRSRSDVPTIEFPVGMAYDGVAVHEFVQIPPENESQQPPTPKDLPPSYESLFPDR